MLPVKTLPKLKCYPFVRAIAPVTARQALSTIHWHHKREKVFLPVFRWIFKKRSRGLRMVKKIQSMLSIVHIEEGGELRFFNSEIICTNDPEWISKVKLNFQAMKKTSNILTWVTF